MLDGNRRQNLCCIYELLLHCCWKINTGKDMENMAGWYLIKGPFQRPEYPLLWRQQLTGSPIQSISICALRQSHIPVTIYLLKFIFSFAFLSIHRSLSFMSPEHLSPCGLSSQLLVLWSPCAKGTQRLWKWWLEDKTPWCQWRWTLLRESWGFFKLRIHRIKGRCEP